MKRIVIRYSENHNKSILLALSQIREHSNMEFGEMEKLGIEFFINKKDIYYDVPIENLESLFRDLKFVGFSYDVLEL